MIDDYRRLLNLIFLYGFDTIDSLSDDELRKVMCNE